MVKLQNPYNYTLQELAMINALLPFTGDSWNRVKHITRQIREHLITEQNDECAYCGLPLKETSRPEVDHIAARKVDDARYPEFTFEPQNLAVACSYCNGSSCKGDKNTIDTYHAQYRNCTFTIVHPYLDDTNLHLSFERNNDSQIIRGLSPRGIETIRMFKLDSAEKSEARVKKIKQEQFKNARRKHPRLATLIERALEFIS